MTQPDYTDIANRAQAVTGRSIMPSTVKAVIDAFLATPAAPTEAQLNAAIVRSVAHFPPAAPPPPSAPAAKLAPGVWHPIPGYTPPPSAEAEDAGRTAVRRFTAYRRNISQRDTHTAFQKNADDEPQFEGVVFTDGSVALRWRTACKSTSVWASLADCLLIHGHPEYGTEIVWHDGDEPPEWTAQVDAARRAQEDRSAAG